MATGLIGPAVSTHIPGPGPHSVLDLGLVARGPGQPESARASSWLWLGCYHEAGHWCFPDSHKISKTERYWVVHGFQIAFFLDGTADSAPDPSGQRQEDSVPS